MTEEHLQRTLGSIEQGVREINRRLTEAEKRDVQTDNRLGSLERWRSLLSGAWLVLGALVAFVAKKLL